MPSAPRNAFIDAAKALACTAIVWHHLAFYGPISDTLAAAAPGLADWLVQYARMAVEIFLVVAGYLAVASFSRAAAQPPKPVWTHIAGRFRRLVVPYCAALSVVILVNALVQPWLDDPHMVGADPTLLQLVTHALLLNGVLGQESLSAGVWYVAIDFQLFALAALLLLGLPRLLRRFGAADGWWSAHATAWVQTVTVAGVALSLFWFNREPALDNWALYFFGAYALGLFAYWSAHAPTRRAACLWALLIGVVTALALAQDWRGRIFLAGVTALLLVLAQRAPALARWCRWAPIAFLARISYCVFLIHFALCLAANALVVNLWPDSVAAALLALPVTYLLALAAGWALHEGVERRARTWRVLPEWALGLIGLGLATALLD